MQRMRSPAVLAQCLRNHQAVPPGAASCLIEVSLVERRRGKASLFQDAENLGLVTFDFQLHDDSTVTGTIEHAGYVSWQPDLEKVPETMRLQSIIERDLRLSLGDGTGVAFLLPSPYEGAIVDGRRYSESA